MAAKKDSGNRIIKPLAAAFLVTAPEEDDLEEKKKAPAKPAARPAAEVKTTGELSKEETRALLKEQLVSLSPDEKAEEKAEEKPKDTEKAPVPKKTDKKAEKAAEKEAEKKPEKAAEKVQAPAAVEEKEPLPEPEEALTIEYGDLSITREELVNRALKIWTSKLKRGRSELHTLELYVKPQERKAYYVFNKKKNGDFDI